jgi:hypothetical protein
MEHPSDYLVFVKESTSDETVLTQSSSGPSEIGLRRKQPNGDIR